MGWIRVAHVGVWVWLLAGGMSASWAGGKMAGLMNPSRGICEGNATLPEFDLKDRKSVQSAFCRISGVTTISPQALSLISDVSDIIEGNPKWRADDGLRASVDALLSPLMDLANQARTASAVKKLKTSAQADEREFLKKLSGTATDSPPGFATACDRGDPEAKNCDVSKADLKAVKCPAPCPADLRHELALKGRWDRYVEFLRASAQRSITGKDELAAMDKAANVPPYIGPPEIRPVTGHMRAAAEGVTMPERTGCKAGRPEPCYKMVIYMNPMEDPVEAISTYAHEAHHASHLDAAQAASYETMNQNRPTYDAEKGLYDGYHRVHGFLSKYLTCVGDTGPNDSECAGKAERVVEMLGKSREPNNVAARADADKKYSEAQKQYRELQDALCRKMSDLYDDESLPGHDAKKPLDACNDSDTRIATQVPELMEPYKQLPPMKIDGVDVIDHKSNRYPCPKAPQFQEVPECSWKQQGPNKLMPIMSSLSGQLAAFGGSDQAQILARMQQQYLTAENDLRGAAAYRDLLSGNLGVQAFYGPNPKGSKDWAKTDWPEIKKSFETARDAYLPVRRKLSRESLVDEYQAHTVGWNVLGDLEVMFPNAVCQRAVRVGGKLASIAKDGGDSRAEMLCGDYLCHKIAAVYTEGNQGMHEADVFQGDSWKLDLAGNTPDLTASLGDSDQWRQGLDPGVLCPSTGKPAREAPLRLDCSADVKDRKPAGREEK